HIRSYAGAPLKTPNGQNLGSFCIMDAVPCQFSAEQQEMLLEMSAIVVDELELRRTARDLRDREAVLRQTLRQNSQLATAITNLTSGVLITDPNQTDNPIIFANAGFSAVTGYSVEDVIGRNCRFLQGPETDPVLAHEIRRAIAERRTFTGTLLNYRKDGAPFVNELTISPVYDEGGELLSFVGLQNDVTEREQAKQLLEQRVRERTAELAESQIEILSRLARAGEFRDDMTGQHTQRVAHTSALLAQALGHTAEEVEMIRQAAPLHDVGKIGIPDHILLKPAKLTEEEYAAMQRHAAMGAALLANGRSEVVQMAQRIAGSHHERWDGRGYPEGLPGEQIPWEGRVLAVADVFDALTHARPYKPAWSLPEAVAEIERGSGQHFDPQVVAAFRRLPHEALV
ncbi:MAG: PAS domain-containing protein, partial [Abitibacteriaceae bacterium]|nr:PAS domain-containing protein [Abditibacteriaceae bacterium]